MFTIWNKQIRSISRRDERAMPLHRERGATLKALNLSVPEGSDLFRQNFVTRHSHIEGYARSSMPRPDVKYSDQMKQLLLGRV